MGKVTIPTTGYASGQWQAPLSTRHRGKWCCGQWLQAEDFLAENFAAKFASSNEPLQLGFLFSVCAPHVSQHNNSGRCSQNGHRLQFSCPNNSAGDRGEGGREREKPQTSEKEENISKLYFKNEKIKFAKSQYTALYSSNLVPYSGQATEEETLWGSEACQLCFHSIKNILKFPSQRA